MLTIRPIIWCDHNDILVRGKATAIVFWGGVEAKVKKSTIDPKHHRLIPTGSPGCEDINVEAVFAFPCRWTRGVESELLDETLCFGT